MKPNFNTLVLKINLLFIFLKLLAIFSALKLLSAWKIEFQDNIHQIFDIVDLDLET